jgi:hypothetical protein
MILYVSVATHGHSSSITEFALPTLPNEQHCHQANLPRPYNICIVSHSYNDTTNGTIKCYNYNNKVTPNVATITCTMTDPVTYSYFLNGINRKTTHK